MVALLYDGRPTKFYHAISDKKVRYWGWYQLAAVDRDTRSELNAGTFYHKC